MDSRPPLRPDRRPARQMERAGVRSIILRWRPGCALDSIPLRAVREPATARDVAGLVGMAPGGPQAPLAGGLGDVWNRVDQRLDDQAVVAGSAGQPGGQWDPTAVADHPVFLARLGAIGGIGADRLAPLCAGTLAHHALGTRGVFIATVSRGIPRFDRHS